MGLYFNLSEEEREFARRKTHFSLVIYDIVSNKRRTKLAHLLEGYGVRVQRSCFEVCLDKKEFRHLLADLEDFYQEEERDNIIVYQGNKEDIIIFNAYDGAEKEEELIFL